MPSRSLPVPCSSPSSSRRRFLASVATALGVGVAGCSTGNGSTVDDPGTTRTPTTAAAASGGGTTSQVATPTTRTTDATPTTATTGSTATTTGTPVHADYETTEVRVTTPDGDPLGSVTAAIADTSQLRYTGLSDTESLPADRGMLFVFGEVQDLTFVMRRMDFAIDIVYADAGGVITSIHHAPAPGPGEDGNQQRYPGRGQYVLEVNYDWTTDRGVETGDVLAFEL